MGYFHWIFYIALVSFIVYHIYTRKENQKIREKKEAIRKQQYFDAGVEYKPRKDRSVSTGIYISLVVIAILGMIIYSNL